MHAAILMTDEKGENIALSADDMANLNSMIEGRPVPLTNETFNSYVRLGLLSPLDNQPTTKAKLINATMSAFRRLETALKQVRNIDGNRKPENATLAGMRKELGALANRILDLSIRFDQFEKKGA